MISFKKLKLRANIWRKDEEGSIAVETLLMVPLLAWVFIATLTYFDAYRKQAASLRAGMTVSDMFSRETNVDADFVEGARGLLRYLAPGDPNPDIRVTAFKWDDDDDEYSSIWSEERGPRDALSTADLATITEILPLMSDNEVAILVETWIKFEPKFSAGLEEYDMTTYTVISPRFTPHICWDETPGDGDDSDMTC